RTIGVANAARAAATRTVTKAARTARGLRGVAGGGARRRITVGGAAMTGPRARGDTKTRIDGAKRVSGVNGDPATGVTCASRASAQPAESEDAMSVSASCA